MSDDADKTTATEGLTPIPFDEPDTIATEINRGGWLRINQPVGPVPPKPRRMSGPGDRDMSEGQG